MALPHLAAVNSVAFGLTRDADRAEDLVQETYLRAYAGFAGYRGGSARSWLVSICLNTGRSELRRQRRRPAEVLEPDLASYPTASSEAEDASTVVVDRLAIGDAFDTLPDEQRMSVWLCDVVGLTAREVADVMGCPRGTVLARVHRGRRRLAQLLADRSGPG